MWPSLTFRFEFVFFYGENYTTLTMLSITVNAVTVCELTFNYSDTFHPLAAHKIH